MAAAASKAVSEADVAQDAASSAPRGKKKLIIMISVAALVVLLAGGGGAAYFVMKKRAAAAAAAAEEGGEAATKEEKKAHKPDLKSAPTFVPLDPFTVNLADRDAERYAQVGMTLELSDAKAGDLLKAYMPAIRNNILLVLASKTAGQLMEHEGKVQLATEVRAAALKPLGYDTATVKKGAAKTSDDDDVAPIKAVHFSNFIIQ